ncbi:O-acetyltransferase OatA [Terricaulis silvestris]|uniref:O-acetyltransferase OatA n=1 Tax=Terricaulis silvestris TaxID=2686094 RepID=A0A6I6MR23_9CAUL|nr:O-acetyltransferase OatA [Terricaulis silvestris]
MDVFFVISGFLIGQIILEETRAGTFTLGGFYARRIRRLFPALFVMLAVTAAVSALVLYPAYFDDFGRSLVAAAASVSNFYFLSTANYFDAAVETKPLLHTWSLAVEEQFYLTFPLIALALAKRSIAAVRGAFVAMFLVSLGWSAWTATHDSHAAFYLPHLRAWELLLGVLLALGVGLRPKTYLTRSIAAILGVALIVAPIFLYDANTVFPGLGALPPCLGAALLIVAGENGRHALMGAFCWRPTVFIGLISYSLYLWHWPIITLYQQYTGDLIIPWPLKLALLALSLAMATASWWFVERPFRRRARRAVPVLVLGGAAVASAAAVGALVVGFHGFPERFDPEVVRIASYLERPTSAAQRGKTCYLQASENRPFSDFDLEGCLRIRPAQTNILVFGDSHAQHLLSGLRSLWPSANILQATASGCRPLLGRSLRSAAACVTLKNYVYNSVITNPDIDLIIIAGRWDESHLARMERSFTALEPLASRVIIVGPIAQYDAAVPQLVALGRRFHDPGLADSHLRANIPTLDREVRRLAQRHGLTYFSAYETLCPARNCRQLNAEGVPYQYDYGHLTDEGSTFVTAHLLSDWRRSHHEPG